MPDTYLILCPHCRHKVHLPGEYLGRVVTCLECQKPFRGPVKDGDGLTDPVPLKPSQTVPARLFIPLVGMLLLGVSGLALNAYLLSDPEAARAFKKSTLDNLFSKVPDESKEWKAADRAKPPSQEELKRREDVSEAFRREQQRKLDRLTDEIPDSRPMRIFGLITAALTFLGGLTFALRRGYWLAFLGCLGCALNSPDIGCCFFGVIVAIWGVLALVSEEGRRYFRVAPVISKPNA